MANGLKVTREVLSVILTVARHKVFSSENIHNVKRHVDLKANKITYEFKYVYESGEFENVTIKQEKPMGIGWYRVECDARNYDGHKYWNVVSEPYAYIRGGF